MGVDLKQIDASFLLAVNSTLAKRSFLDFIRFVQPDYLFNWHHLALINALQRLSDKEFQRLIVMMPPRHGKSQLVSRLFPAWCFARNINEQVIVSSYALDLASAMNRDCQRIITSEKYAELFPETKLSDGESGYMRTTKRFDIVGGKGYYLAAGVGGGITGAGATVGIIDDPVKNAEDADSKTIRDKTWEWYRTTFRTRFEPGAIEVICQTRWHDDDLTGRILKGHKSGVEIISLPALCEAPEENRSIGDALWPERYSREVLLETKADVGTRSWIALYQQKPSDEDGGLIKRAWFSRYDPRKYSFANKKVNFFVDTAYTNEEKNDPTAAIAYVKEGSDYYVLEVASDWMEFNEQVKFVKDFTARNGYSGLSIVRVEPKATGKSIVQVMKAGTSLNIREGVSPKDSKIARVNSVSGVVEGGRVFLPEGMEWVTNFLNECAAFPNAAHDDQVDCLTGMIQNETSGKAGIRFANG